MNHVLLIGGAGFIGSNIITHLLGNKGYSISVLEPEFASLHRLIGMPVNVYRGHIANYDEIKAIIMEEKIDTVIHLVSTIIPGSSFEDFQREFTDVIFPSIRLMELCCEKKIRFVYFSSGGTVYGNRKGQITPFTEDSPMAPISFYGWSKQMMENSIHYMHRTQGLHYLIFRPSNPYGKGQNLYGKQGFIAVALGKILSGDIIQVWGDGSSIRDYIYIDDLGKAVVAILSNNHISNTTLNIGSGVGYNINQIIEILRQTVVERVNVEYLEARQVDVSSVILDTNKLCNFINFCPLKIQDGIKLFYKDIRHGK